MQSLATMTSGRPSGYSGVFSVVIQPTIPTVFEPTIDWPRSIPLPSAFISSSSTSSRLVGIASCEPSVIACCHAAMIPFSMRPRKSYAYVVPMRRATARLFASVDDTGYGSRKHTSSSFAPTEQYDCTVPVTGSRNSRYPSVFSHCPPIDDAISRTACRGAPAADCACTRTSISSTRSLRRRVAWREITPDMSSVHLSMISSGDLPSIGARTWRKRCDDDVPSTRLSSSASWSSSSDFISVASAAAVSADATSAEWVTPRTKRRCWRRGFVPCSPSSTCVLWLIEFILTGAQPATRSSSRRFHIVGYMSRRSADSAKPSSPRKANWRGHFGGLGTISDTSFTPFAFSADAAAATAFDAVAIVDASASPPAPIVSVRAMCSTLLPLASPLYSARSLLTSRSARVGTTASWP